MGITCGKKMSTVPMDKNRTVKVSGISQHLRDELTKAFQSKNSGYDEDVNRVHVCPKGQDHVLVEFADDIKDFHTRHDKIEINGSKLKVEKWKSETASVVDPTSERVSKIWTSDGTALPDYDENIIVNRPNGENKKDRRQNEIKDFRREAREKTVRNRRYGKNSDEETMFKPPFSEARVKLNDDAATKLQEAELQEMLQKENIQLDQQGFLTGTWNAIFSFGRKLVHFISGLDLTDPGSNFSFSSTTKDNQPSGAPTATDQSGDPSTMPTAGGLVTSSDQSQPSTQPDESFAVSALFLRYIMEYQYEIFQKLENVCKEISFEVVSKAERNLKLTARDDLDEKKFLKTIDNFIDFYQKQNQRMIQEDIVKLPKDKKDVISEARTKFSVVITPAQDPDKTAIYGVKDKVEEAKSFLKSKVGTSYRGGASTEKTATEPSLTEKLSYNLSADLKLVVYQGDLTKENVDAIVNPANDRLQHGGGAAGAIVKAGGRSIQDASDDIMRKRRDRPLQPGDVEVTEAGRLPCKFVVHAVGPIWNHHTPNTAKQLLYEAVSRSLFLASRNGAKSISVPAIGSGLYKVPVDVCAQVLFDAVINFATNTNKSSHLKEIHFVNIDSPTNRAFLQEMEKRFSGPTREKIEILRENVKEQERQTQFRQQQIAVPTTNSGRNSQRYQTTQATHKDSSHTNPNGDKTGGRSSTGDKPPLLSYAGVTAGNKPAAGHDPKAVTDGKTSKDDVCSICLSEFTKKKTLDKCGHSFCTDCIDKAFKSKKQCPICFKVYGPLIGNQPKGSMYDSYQSTSLPGFGSSGTTVISYRFPSGIQGPDHPNPGKPYTGTSRTAYLPHNQEGRKVLKLLKKAFDQKLMFTIGRSTTTGRDDCVTWNDIHHKTSMTGGPAHYGYPDPDYLTRVKDELAAKGITE